MSDEKEKLDEKSIIAILERIESRDQLLAEIVLRLSTLENVLVEKGLIDRDLLIDQLKKSVKKLVETLTENGVVKDSKAIIDMLNNKNTIKN